MNEIKLIALDMDGTLFNTQGKVSEKDKETLIRLVNDKLNEKK